MKPNGIRVCVALALALIPPAAAAQNQPSGSASFAACSVPVAPPPSKDPAAPDLRDAVSAKGSAFSQGTIDLFGLSSQDPLTRRAMKEETQRALSPEDESPHWRIASAPAAAPKTFVSKQDPPRPVPGLDPSFASGASVLAGSPRDADGAPPSDATTVYEPASSGIVEGFTKSPSLYSELSRMSESARRAQRAADPQQAQSELQRLWGAPGPTTAEPTEPPASDGTKFFNLR